MTEAQVGVLVERRHPDDTSGEALQRCRSVDVTAATPRATGLNSRGPIEANGRDVWVSRINRQESAERQGYPTPILQGLPDAPLR